jgi:hypothetical protein
MSALGQQRTCRAEIAMSALLPRADIHSDSRDVSFGPETDIHAPFPTLIFVKVEGLKAKTFGHSCNDPRVRFQG